MITLSPLLVVQFNELLREQSNPFYVDEHGGGENFIAKLKNVDKTNSLRFIGITLEAEDPLWQSFYSFIVRHGLTVEEGLRRSLAYSLRLERFQRTRERKITKLCPQCGGKKWLQYATLFNGDKTTVVRCASRECKTFYTVTRAEAKGLKNLLHRNATSKILRFPYWRRRAVREWEKNHTLTSLFPPQSKE